MNVIAGSLQAIDQKLDGLRQSLQLATYAQAAGHADQARLRQAIESLESERRLIVDAVHNFIADTRAAGTRYAA